MTSVVLACSSVNPIASRDPRERIQPECPVERAHEVVTTTDVSELVHQDQAEVRGVGEQSCRNHDHGAAESAPDEWNGIGGRPGWFASDPEFQRCLKGADSGRRGGDCEDSAYPCEFGSWIGNPVVA